MPGIKFHMTLIITVVSRGSLTVVTQ